jgi:serine/threonine protein kinase
VIRLFGLFIDSNQDNYMVMEYVAKGSLKHLVSRDRNLTMNDLFDMYVNFPAKFLISLG